MKILHEGYGGRDESIKRFLREARAASLINHPNIVDVTDFGKSNDGTVFFVMELLQRRAAGRGAVARPPPRSFAGDHDHQPGGGRAGRRALEGDRAPRSQAREHHAHAARGTPRADSADHRRAGLHTISEREKAFDFVKILDFGVAKVRDPDASEGRVTQQGVVFGTPEYMAPETARIGISDPRTDI